jgi:magnesium chelatase subunit D
MHQLIFPFTAIVGQERMKRALVLNAINPAIGGVLIRGERGTAKSTAARALAALLPEIEVIAGCRFGCTPNHSDNWCDECRERMAAGEELLTTWRQISFVDLPVSATEDRVVGTLDIEKAIQKGERHFEPGVLASANHGILYVDEVNLLDDHVVDLLLDSAAMGVNVVEREGISFSHPARFILVGTMNPEEGDLRPQLLDRFALCVDVRGLAKPADRIAILERHVAFEQDPEGFYEEWLPQERKLAEEIARAREMVSDVEYTRRDMATIATLTADLRVDGHRADLVILKAARAHAALEGRKTISDLDILMGAELALAHRIRRGPFEETALSVRELEQRLEQASLDAEQTEMVPSREVDADSSDVKKNENLEQDPPRLDEAPEIGQPEPGPQDVFPDTDARWWEGGQRVQPGAEFNVARRLDTPLDRLTRRQAGRRSRTRTDRKRGRYIQARPVHGKTNDIAFDATLRAAAPHQVEREHGEMAFAVRPEDIHEKVRVKRASNLVLFVVDASWSMAVAERMTATKGAIMSLLTDAYQQRDRVGLVVFQKDRALLVLRPTSSVQLARKALTDIPVGGKTPLSAGLFMALQLFRQERLIHPDVLPLMILLTDGAGNVSMGSLPPQDEAHRIADQIREEGVRAVVVNMEHTSFDQGLAQAVADHLGGPCYTLSELKAEILYQTVRSEMASG